MAVSAMEEVFIFRCVGNGKSYIVQTNGELRVVTNISATIPYLRLSLQIINSSQLTLGRLLLDSQV